MADIAKFVEEIKGLTVMELADLVKAIEEEFGVSAAAPVMVAGPAAEHASIAPAAEFAVTDTIFNEFKRFIDPKRFNYDKVCEQGLSQLKKVAEAEGYMTDSTKAEFAKLEKLLKHNLDHDLDNNRKAISQLLSGEILKRYYYQRGVIENSLNSDEALQLPQAMHMRMSGSRRAALR